MQYRIIWKGDKLSTARTAKDMLGIIRDVAGRDNLLDIECIHTEDGFRIDAEVFRAYHFNPYSMFRISVSSE